MDPSKTNLASTSSSVGTYTVKSTSSQAPDVVAQIIDPTDQRPPRQADYKIRQGLPSSEGPFGVCTSREAIVLDKLPQLGLDRYISCVANAVQPAKVLIADELQPASVCVFVSDAKQAESQHGRILPIDDHSLLMRPLTQEPLVRVLATDVLPFVPDDTIRRYLAMHHNIEVKQIVYLKTGEQTNGNPVFGFARHLYVAADDVAKFPAKMKGKQDGWPYTIYFGSEEHWCVACQRVGHFEWNCDKRRMAKYIGSRDCCNGATFPAPVAIHIDPPSTPTQPKGLVSPMFVLTPPSQSVGHESGMSSNAPHDIDRSIEATSPMRSPIKQAQKDMISLMQNLNFLPSPTRSMTYLSPGKQTLNVENSLTQNLSLSPGKQTLNVRNSLTRNRSLSPSVVKPMTYLSPGKQALNVENSRIRNLSLSPSAAKPMTSNLRSRSSTSIFQKIKNSFRPSPTSYAVTACEPETDLSSEDSSTSASSTTSSPSSPSPGRNTFVQNLFAANTTPSESRLNMATLQRSPRATSWNASSPTNRSSSPSNAASALGPSETTTSSSTGPRVIEVPSDRIPIDLIIHPASEHLAGPGTRTSPRNNSTQ
ncbi:uncharacterized protein LOC106649750 isoform X2 [Trichogramma pretiosum]|uniref:uncharacterized protein LOC106649750 isoform X2 n=1 Tax=Trichogramma pretiosum TaxID=7493 RepID=UPI000C719E12|nr:uncharacterized protein LOC106649750 isoform X2 [Trichogramma pretiosum]